MAREGELDPMTAAKFAVKPVTRATWQDLEALFEGQGFKHVGRAGSRRHLVRKAV